MRTPGSLLCGAGLALLVLCAGRAAAAGFDCNAARGPIDGMICADARLSQLDSRLSATYATVLARDPAQAAALREDERGWLAERDDLAWRALSNPWEEGAPVARTRLARLYRQRIAFLDGVDNPLDERGSPATRRVISGALALPAGSGDVLRRFEDTGLISAPRPHRFHTMQALQAALPAPPDPVLRAALQAHAAGARFRLSYLPRLRLGGVLESDADGCDWWVPFRSAANATGDVSFPRAEWWGCPARPGRFGAIGRYPAILTQFRGPGWSALQWWRWSGGDSGPVVRVEIRFAPALQLAQAACAAPWPCVALRNAALEAARRYDARPLPGTLDDTARLDPRQRAAYHEMLTYAASSIQRLGGRVAAAWFAGEGPYLARVESAGHDVQRAEQLATAGLPGFGAAGEPDIPGWFGADAAYFPAQVAGELLLGRIGHPRLGWRTRATAWMVGYWRWHDGALQPVAGFVVDRRDGKPLLAARVQDLP